MQKQSSTSSRKQNHHQQSQDNLIESNISSLNTQTKESTNGKRNDSTLYETKRISLRLCYIFRRSSSSNDLLVLSSSSTTTSPLTTAAPMSSTTDSNGAILDIVLPYAQTCYSVRFVDDMHARKWFHIIHSKISRCLLEILPEIEEHFYGSRNANEVKALGWLTEQVNSEESNSITTKSWKPVFLVLTDAEICFLCCAPVSRQTCREPDIVYSILSTR